MAFLLKSVAVILFWGVFIFIVFNIPYPENLAQANLSQLVLFFTALYLATTLTINLFLKNIFQSLSVTLGLIFLLILKALDSLNIVTGLLILITIGLLFSYFKKTKRENGIIRAVRRIRGNKLNRV